MICACKRVVIASAAKQSHEIAESLTLLAMTLLIAEQATLCLLNSDCGHTVCGIRLTEKNFFNHNENRDGESNIVSAVRRFDTKKTRVQTKAFWDCPKRLLVGR